MILKTRNNGNFLPSIFEDFLSNLEEENIERAFSQPAFNVYETEKEFVVEAAVPGLDKKDFNIEVNDNVLNISCEYKNEEKKEEKKYFYRGFSYGNFQKSYSLPENVNGDKISASYENGVLKINIPKEKEIKLSKQIKVG